MKKYFAIYLAPVTEMEKMMKNSTPDQMKAGMDDWMKWAKECGSAISDLGAPLGKTKRVTTSGISDVKNEISGYTIVEAESHDAAAKLFGSNPHLHIPGAIVDIMEIVKMPGM